MKNHNEAENITNPKSKSNSLAALLAAAALGISTTGVYAQIIITPNQFTTSSWNNLVQSTVGAYSGDGAFGYYQTANYGSSPSGLINVPLTGLTPGWNLYDIYEWNPVGYNQWHVVNVINNGIGYGTSVVPGEPWAGQFGTQQQYLAVDGTSPVGQWAHLGPGPQSDSSLGGYQVWINGSGAPSFLQIHYMGFEGSMETFDAFMVVAVPEPSALALGLFGGFALFLGIASRKH